MATDRRQQLTLSADLALELWQPLFEPAEADALLTALLDGLPWQQPRLRLYGREHPIPRLQSWHGDPDAHYRYSGLPMTPLPWTPALTRIREHLSELTGHRFNSVLANLYRDGRDSMGWHADDEPELGPTPWVASVSFGVTRDFSLRRKGQTRTHSRIPLVHNSLLLMPPEMQAHWQHALPKRAKVDGARVNLTFRKIGSDV